ncbi:LppX_LprAFG lipoprotein [Nocardia sp. NPDC051052]|uniref:LppX_LprAFG lipoprotein n=1 Tax=Nocardia sp. NPDC051052 TaxID=3364322 RepID=UPI00379EC640
MLVAASCSLDGGLPDAALMVRNAALASGSIHSAHVVLESDGAVPGLPVRRIDADLTTGHTNAAKGSIKPILGPPMDFVSLDGALYTKSPSGTFAPANARVIQLPNLLDPDRGLAHVLANIRQPKTVDREDRLGIDSFKVTGVVPAEDIEQLLPDVRTDANMTIWLRVKGTHVPVDTTLTFPNTTSLLDIKFSDVNKQVTITTPELR